MRTVHASPTRRWAFHDRRLRWGADDGGVDDAPTAVKCASDQARRLGEREVDEIPLTVVAW